MACFLGLFIAEFHPFGGGGLPYFTMLTHELIYFMGVTFGLLVGMQDAAGRCVGCHSRVMTAVAAVSKMRSVIDPAMWFAIAVVLIVHVHDRREIATLYHTLMGVMMMTLGVVVLLCSLAHHTASHDHPTCKTLRLILAFVHILPGQWFMSMGLWMYSNHSGGLHERLQALGAKTPSPQEEVGVLLGASFVTSAMVLSIVASKTVQLVQPYARLEVEDDEIDSPTELKVMETTLGKTHQVDP